MKKMVKILFATTLVTGAMFFTPAKASSDSIACQRCDQTMDCVSCCVCAGGTPAHCSILCS